MSHHGPTHWGHLGCPPGKVSTAQNTLSSLGEGSGMGGPPPQPKELWLGHHHGSPRLTSSRAVEVQLTLTTLSTGPAAGDVLDGTVPLLPKS